jgi:membrane protease YdiL (CAAX protease family)
MDTVFTNTSRRAPTDDRSGWLILLATVCLTQFYYWLRADRIGVGHGDGWFAMTGGQLALPAHVLGAAVILGLVPVVFAVFSLKFRPVELGLGLGRPRRGLVWLALGVPVAILLAWLSAADPRMAAVYPLERSLVRESGPLAGNALWLSLYYGAWELLFRGVLLFGLQRRWGFAQANVIQTALSVLAHFGRAYPETMAAIPAGLAFGGVARHTRSIWYVAIIHWTAGVAQDYWLLTLSQG